MCNQDDDQIAIINNIKNINKIVNQIVYNFEFKASKSGLEGIICCPYAGHYTCILVKINEDYKFL